MKSRGLVCPGFVADLNRRGLVCPGVAADLKSRGLQSKINSPLPSFMSKKHTRVRELQVLYHKHIFIYLFIYLAS